MNYYSPYFSAFPYTAAPASTGLFSRLASGVSGIRWGSLLSGTQKILGVANQAIPVIKQVSPVVKNAKTMFRVMNEFKKVDTPVSTQNEVINNNDNEIINESQINSSYSDGPTFFI